MTPEQFFSTDQHLFSASAPGRLDVMGGIADYSGALVLEMPIDASTRCQMAVRSDKTARLFSRDAALFGGDPHVDLDLSPFLESQDPPYSAFKLWLHQHPSQAWAGYVLGVLLVLHKELGTSIPGMDIYLESDVPPGKGVSSSASVEVAVMTAAAKALNLSLSDTELPTLCQKVENEVMDAPCGLMDQLTCYLGRAHHLLPILCQPDQVQAPMPLPPDITFVGIDSGVRHQVRGASYGDVRTAAFMGYTIIASAAGATKEDLLNAHTSRDASALPYQGYLANIAADDYEQSFQHLLPERMSGNDFLSAYGHSIDHATQVAPDRDYAIRVCVDHPVYEQRRIKTYQSLLSNVEQDERG